MKALGICLFYDDEDIAEDAIEYLLENNHQLLVWDNTSTDGTMPILEKYKKDFIELNTIPHETYLLDVFEQISEYVIEKHAKNFDWISFPNSDEFLEGPTREKSYYEHLLDVYNSEYDWISFHNLTYWFTEKDNDAIKSSVKRVRYYSSYGTDLPKVFSWRASKMNKRFWNHNPALGLKYPKKFNARHYQMRSLEQMRKRLFERTAGLRRGGYNIHNDFMFKVLDKLIITSDELYYDDGKSELRLDEKFNWQSIYGTRKDLRMMAQANEEVRHKDWQKDWQEVEDKFALLRARS